MQLPAALCLLLTLSVGQLAAGHVVPRQDSCGSVVMNCLEGHSTNLDDFFIMETCPDKLQENAHKCFEYCA